VNILEIKALAKERGVKSGTLKKIELVQAIQAAEGNEQCFGVGRADSCGQDNCLWKADCN
jgi:hypothetical protein